MLTFEASVSGNQIADGIIEDEEEFAEFCIRFAELIKLLTPASKTMLLQAVEDQATKGERILVRELASFFSSISE